MRRLRPLEKMFVVEFDGRLFAYRTRKEFMRDSPMHNQSDLKQFARSVRKPKTSKNSHVKNDSNHVAMW